MLPIGRQLGLAVGSATAEDEKRTALVVACAGHTHDPRARPLADKHHLARFVGYAAAGDPEETRPAYVIAASSRIWPFGGVSKGRLLGRYVGQVTVGEGEEADTRPAFVVATCCPPQVGCIKAIDDFELPNGSEPSGFWRYAGAALGGDNRPRIVDGELGFAETSALLLHCSEFGSTGSIEVDVEGAAGDAALLMARHYDDHFNALGDGWGLAYRIESDHHVFHLGVTVSLHEGPPGGSGFCQWSQRYFKLPGGPGDRRRIRLCWFRDEDGQQDVAVGEVYDEAGELVFRERSRFWDGSAPSYLLGSSGVRHGIAGGHKTTGATSTLKLDNYLATIPDESDYQCPACAFEEFSICVQMLTDDCEFVPQSQVAIPRTLGGTPSLLCDEHCVSRMHLWWAGSGVDVLLGQTFDGEWIAFLYFITGLETECCLQVTLDLAGAYPTTENLMAALEATEISDPESACCSGAIVSRNLEQCGYYEDGGGEDLCDDFDELPETLTGTITGNRGDTVTLNKHVANLYYNGTGALPEWFYEMTFFPGFGWLFAINGAPSPADGFFLTVLGCDPVHMEGSAAGYNVEITE